MTKLTLAFYLPPRLYSLESHPHLVRDVRLLAASQGWQLHGLRERNWLEMMVPWRRVTTEDECGEIMQGRGRADVILVEELWRQRDSSFSSIASIKLPRRFNPE